jgi:Zn-dependent peptidase ImmA (M78 family)/DNA-binding XRE family transcriptional regulator
MTEAEGKVKIVASQLTRGRNAVGLSSAEAANRLNVSEIVLSSWEQGRESPDAEELYEIATIYRRPIAYFYEETKEERTPLDLRKGKVIPGVIDTKIKEGLRQFEQYCELQWELEEVMNKKRIIDIGTATLEDNIESLANAERDRLKYVGGRKNSFRLLRRRCNEHGIKVFGLSLPEELDGASLWHKTYGPAILINLTFSQPRTFFTLAHEYSHLMLLAKDSNEVSVLCDLNDELKIEQYCNRFASAFLIPFLEFKTYLHERNLRLMDYYNVDTLATVAHDFKISRHVVAIRLEEIEEVERGFYWRIKDQLKEVKPPHFGRSKEWKRKKEKIFGDYYTNLALEAYKRGNLTYSSLSKHMDLRLGQLGELLKAESLN